MTTKKKVNVKTIIIRNVYILTVFWCFFSQSKLIKKAKMIFLKLIIIAQFLLKSNGIISFWTCFFFKNKIYRFVYEAQGGKFIGDMCIPGMCLVMNANCKWNGQIFKCVCKDNYLPVNQTHCGYSLAISEDNQCKNCLETESVCLDYNNDKRMDECWCPKLGGCRKYE